MNTKDFHALNTDIPIGSLRMPDQTEMCLGCKHYKTTDYCYHPKIAEGYGIYARTAYNSDCKGKMKELAQ